jgi:acetyl-CoA C-acetyltransferase
MSADNLPVIIGVGEVCTPVPEDLETAPSIVDLGAMAALKACQDIQSDAFSTHHIDAIVATRLIAEALPGYTHPFGAVRNLPRAIAKRLNCDPAYAAYGPTSGTSPQTLVSEFSNRIASGEFETVMIVGGEVIANTKAAMRNGVFPDWSDETDGQVQDLETPALGVYYTSQEIQNDLVSPMLIYGMMDNARRNKLQLTRGEYAKKIGDLFQPFSEVAARHPSSMFLRQFPAEIIASPDKNNPQLTDPYTKAMVAKDGVNQACAILLSSEEKARALGIDASRWVYLHSCCSLMEKVLLKRKDAAESPAMNMAYQTALERAGIAQQDIRYFDIYSCFPIVVFNACDALGIQPGDIRGLTVTGGLPFFGGAGNSYSLFGISGIVTKLRKDPATYGLVGTNGWFMSKHAVGIYSGKRPQAGWKYFEDAELQHTLDAEPEPVIEDAPKGEADIVAYTILMKKGRPVRGFIIARLLETNAVFLGATDPEDIRTPARMFEIEPIGQKVTVTPMGSGNRFRLISK